MILSIIHFITALIFAFSGFSIIGGARSVMDETFGAVLFSIASVFLIGGILILTIRYYCRIYFENSTYANNAMKANIITKKCEKCSKEFSGSYTACPHCGYKDIPNALPKVNETKRCANCGLNVDSLEFKCPKCKKEVFV